MGSIENPGARSYRRPGLAWATLLASLATRKHAWAVGLASLAIVGYNNSIGLLAEEIRDLLYVPVNLDSLAKTRFEEVPAI